MSVGAADGGTVLQEQFGRANADAPRGEKLKTEPVATIYYSLKVGSV